MNFVNEFLENVKLKRQIKMNKPKVFMIIGKSYSGKGTLENTLFNDIKFCKSINLAPLVTYTTRLKRPNEIDGKDYFFISDEYYKEHFKDNKDIIDTMYRSDFGELHYITDLSRLEHGKNYLVANGAPEMIQPYRDILGDENLIIIYLIPPDWSLFQRFSKRNDNAEYSEKKWIEVHRRYLDDLIKFGKSNQFLANTNCIINIGQEVFFDRIKAHMIRFIKNNISHSGFIFSKDSNISFSNKYTPAISYENSKAYDNILKGKIYLKNCAIVIDTESESFEQLKI